MSNMTNNWRRCRRYHFSYLVWVDQSCKFNHNPIRQSDSAKCQQRFNWYQYKQERHNLATARESKAHFGLLWVRPSDQQSRQMSHGRKEKFNACKTPRCILYPYYVQPFLRYSKLFVENWDIFIPHLCLAAPQGELSRQDFVKILYTHKTRMNGLSCDEESMATDNIFSRFDTIPACDGQTDRQTDRQKACIPKTCISMADARKNG